MSAITGELARALALGAGHLGDRYIACGSLQAARRAGAPVAAELALDGAGAHQALLLFSV